MSFSQDSTILASDIAKIKDGKCDLEMLRLIGNTPTHYSKVTGEYNALIKLNS